MEIFAVDKLAGREEAVPIEADATLSAVKRQCGDAFGFGGDVELSVGGQRMACDDGVPVSSIAAFSGGCRVEVERGVRGFVEQLRSGRTTIQNIPMWAQLRRECVLAALEGYRNLPKEKSTFRRRGKAPPPCFAEHCVPPSLYGDKEVMQQFVQFFPACLPLASPALRRDADVVLASLGVRHPANSLEFPNVEMWLNEKVFVLGALESGKINFNDVSPSLRDDKDVVMKAMDAVFEKDDAGEANEGYDCTFERSRDAICCGDMRALDKMLSSGKLMYRDLSEALRADKEVALKAIASDGVWFEFQHMSEELRGDKEVILKAIDKRVWFEFQHIPQSDKEEVRKALRKVGGRAVDAINYASPVFRDDKDVVMKAMDAVLDKGDGSEDFGRARDAVSCGDMKVLEKICCRGKLMYRDLSATLRGDKEVALKAIASDGVWFEFQHMSEELRGDKEVVLTAIDKRVWVDFQHIHEKLRGDEEVVRKTLQQRGTHVVYTVQHMSMALRGDKEFAMKAVRSHPHAFQYLSEQLRGDEEVAMKALKKDSDAHRHIADVLRNDRDFATRLVTMDRVDCFPSLSDALRDDLQVALSAIRQRGDNFMYAGEHVRGDKEAAMEAFSSPSDIALLAFASADLQADREVGAKAVSANPQNASYASPL